ncbi:hypothetical protein [Paenibacillus ihumii]|uniref:hypothetical protein n=1 Tax=Paenibacillus ihumii TaxID=687436 RepID=UPI0006D7C627|nr:hypothetical protein [Paenibacillus ihumii]
MNPNAIVLTPEQLEALKAEIIEEVRKQQLPLKASRYELMNEIRRHVSPILGDDYRIHSAFSTIARKTFDLRHQTFFYGESLDQATEMIKELVAVIEKFRSRNRKGGENERTTDI